jgi:hypothetical protein
LIAAIKQSLRIEANENERKKHEDKQTWDRSTPGSTLHQLNLPVKIVVFRNDSLDFVELEMKASGFLDFDVELKNPDFNYGGRKIPIHAGCVIRSFPGTGFRGDRARQVAYSVGA